MLSRKSTPLSTKIEHARSQLRRHVFKVRDCQHCDSWASRLGKTPKAHEKACVGINETTQLLSSVPDGGRCRNKSRNGDGLSFHSIAVAHFGGAPRNASCQQENRWKSVKICCARQLRLAMRSAVSCDSQRDKTSQTSKTKTPPKSRERMVHTRQ